MKLAALWWALWALVIMGVEPAAGREAGDPISMAWTEGDVAGLTSILAPDGTTVLGFVEYHQRRRGDVLETVRIAHFADGSSDEEQASASVGKTLRALHGRSLIRDTNGEVTVDLTFDVTNGVIHGFSGLGDAREKYYERVELPEGTYWGPLVFLVVKNFDLNVENGSVVFRTVVATPKPRVFDMELVRGDGQSIPRAGGSIDVVAFALRPTVNWLVDPILRLLAPETGFLVQPGAPPGLARFEGPRNFAGQTIRIE